MRGLRELASASVCASIVLAPAVAAMCLMLCEAVAAPMASHEATATTSHHAGHGDMAESDPAPADVAHAAPHHHDGPAGVAPWAVPAHAPAVGTACCSGLDSLFAHAAVIVPRADRDLVPAAASAAVGPVPGQRPDGRPHLFERIRPADPPVSPPLVLRI